MTAAPSPVRDRLLRPGAVGGREIWRDVLWLLLLGVLLFAPGLGLRDPWPADEPRFALIARDMVDTGRWLIPEVGGDLYQDKPPVFFWAIAAAYLATGTLRLAFLLPSLLAGLGTLWLVYDLGRRLWSRETGLAAALLLGTSVQLVVQARSAQIDMLLTFLTTASLYGIARHLLAGPDWRAYTLGGFAAGLGVVTKGTGFLPLLLLLPYCALRCAGFGGLWSGRGGVRWWLAPAAALVGIALWLVPMLVTTALSADPRLAAYRDEILFQQTLTRYAAAWGHYKPWYFYLLQVIPGLWLPGTVLLPWLVPRWRIAWRERDGRPWLFIGWMALVVLFFSVSPGKRGVYVLPALPAFALAAAPYLVALWRRTGPQRALFALTATLAATAAGAAAYLGLLRPDRLAELGQQYGVASPAPLVAVAAGALVALMALRPDRGGLAWAATVSVVALVTGFWIVPMINVDRSGQAFVATFERAVPAGAELGLVAYREQYLLYATRPVVNFGHRRVHDPEQEAFDAARWLDARPDRVLVVDESVRRACFGGSPALALGEANRFRWFLVSAPANAACADRGDPAAALTYRPPHR